MIHAHIRTSIFHWHFSSHTTLFWWYESICCELVSRGQFAAPVIHSSGLSRIRFRLQIRCGPQIRADCWRICASAAHRILLWYSLGKLLLCSRFPTVSWPCCLPWRWTARSFSAFSWLLISLLCFTACAEFTQGISSLLKLFAHIQLSSFILVCHSPFFFTPEEIITCLLHYIWILYSTPNSTTFWMLQARQAVLSSLKLISKERKKVKHSHFIWTTTTSVELTFIR